MLNLKINAMAKEFNSNFFRKKNLEESYGVIIVKRKIGFVESEEKTRCDNCDRLHKSKTIYEIKNGKHIEICFFCNDKIHNSTATNPRFRKDEIINQNTI